MRRPLCMTDDEWAGWSEANAAMSWPKVRTDSPCRDCTATFAAAMRRRDLCDGTPGRYVGRPPGISAHKPKCPCRAHSAVPA